MNRHTERQQFALDDPYGSDFGGGAYIKSFVRITRGLDLPSRPEAQGYTDQSRRYNYVEAIDPQDGKR
jgi:hypothetical protein